MMQVYKNKAFSKWADKESLSDEALLAAVEEMVRGLVDAELTKAVISGELIEVVNDG